MVRLPLVRFPLVLLVGTVLLTSAGCAEGDLESEVGKSMLNCDPNGKVALMVTNIQTFDKRDEVIISMGENPPTA